MGPKKKGKKSGGGKFSKMTEEERLAYEEQKNLAEEELKKKKEDMLTQFLKVRYGTYMQVYYDIIIYMIPNYTYQMNIEFL